MLVQVALANLLREQNQLDAAAQHLTQSIDLWEAKHCYDIATLRYRYIQRQLIQYVLIP